MGNANGWRRSGREGPRLCALARVMAGGVGLLLTLQGCTTVGTDADAPTNPAQERELIDEIESMADRSETVHQLAFPLLVSNVEACGKRIGPALGATWITQADLARWPKARQVVAKRRFRVARRPVLDGVTAGGPADEAGLRRWDTIVAIDGERISDRASRGDIVRVFETGAGDGRVEITYEREGEIGSATVSPVTACDVGVALVWDDTPNSFTDGSNVYLTSGLVQAESDAGVQSVIAHQLAHIVSGHVDAETGRRVAGALADVGVSVALNMLVVPAALFLLIASEGDVDVLPDEPLHTGGVFEKLAAGMFTHGDEQEADRLSMVMMERAGLSASAVVDFWSDLAAEPADLRALVQGHPFSEERLRNMERALGSVLEGTGSAEAGAQATTGGQ